MSQTKSINIFIIGSKGIPAKYGGFETFVENLTLRRQTSEIQYYVSNLSNKSYEENYRGIKLFHIDVPKIGSARALLYDSKSLIKCYAYIKKNRLQKCVIYILGCRIGPFLTFYKNRLKKNGIRVFVNPDGHEWKRVKWNSIIKKYWKYSEKLMVKYADLVVCDSIRIEHYIMETYKKYHQKTIFIPYGADVTHSEPQDSKKKEIEKFFQKFELRTNEYYLIVGRFVPENNYELLIKEFIISSTKKDLVIICNLEKNKLYDLLSKRTGFEKNPKIKFVGTVYDNEILKHIRENAFAYLHGHEVGGTNPSLLEALASTKINLLLDIDFNREVGGDGALYFEKKPGSLKNLIHQIEMFNDYQVNNLEKKSKSRILNYYSWEKVVSAYEALFSSELTEQFSRQALQKFSLS